MKVKDKVFVVTGGGSGMGRELVLQLLKKDARIAAIDINVDSLLETKSLAGVLTGNLKIYALDITDKKLVGDTLETILNEFGYVDGIINNAGIIQPFKALNDLDYSTINKVFDVNFWGTLNLTKILLPHLLERPEAHIVNISSMGGFFAFPGQNIYGASKAAVKLFTEGLIQELRETRVQVSVVFPGAIRTNIMQNSGLKESVGEMENNNTLSASKAAAIIIENIEKDKQRIFVGNDSRLMDYMYRINPNWAMRFIAKKMKDIRN
ncbi:SDR family NAD(P)-dependent oxidoreductase [Maribacter flavus]|uniref:SDR family NAD(P)-dependent oxidoreductase n=1 Tax=Maribacter flavus TaxID=1658664 RepID=A0A5B2TN03_9FLAO|nr:SDR family NAD(P)-dependent oxidoreductase [Maribacter flavus]KAA2215766.1 SDR family NAD(P)-dependent oxidoreductase [Maribacter flavus]